MGTNFDGLRHGKYDRVVKTTHKTVKQGPVLRSPDIGREVLLAVVAAGLVAVSLGAAVGNANEKPAKLTDSEELQQQATRIGQTVYATATSAKKNKGITIYDTASEDGKSSTVNLSRNIADPADSKSNFLLSGLVKFKLVDSELANKDGDIFAVETVEVKTQKCAQKTCEELGSVTLSYKPEDREWHETSHEPEEILRPFLTKPNEDKILDDSIQILITGVDGKTN